MSGFESPDWYRVAEVRLRLRRDLTVRPHLYLDETWYVLSDATSGKVHRVTAAGYRILGRMNGSRTLAEIWAQAVAEQGEAAPSQKAVIDLLTRMHGADLLDGPDRPLLADLLERRDKDRAQTWKKLVMNPLSVTVPLIDPDRALRHLSRAMAVLPRTAWWMLWLTLVVPALVLLPAQWGALTERGIEGLLDLESLLLIALIYPVVKAIHEIGHGIAIRSRGGEVHEMGLMFIAFLPIPYVEASAAIGFPSKWARASVAAAGVVVELAIAAIAFYVWLAAEPGMVRSIAYNTMVIAGVSTVLVNGNPLLKFDGYHALADVIEIPNLGKRGTEWWGEVLRTRVLGTRERDRLPRSAWELWWFALYPPAAFVYRVFITFTIALMVASTYRALGVVLAIWSVSLSLVWPAAKVVHQAVTDPRIEEAGARARLGALAGGAVVALLLLVPVPHRTVAQGVVWLPEEAFLRAGSAGVVQEVTAGHGDRLAPGAAVLRLENPDLVLAVARAEARLARARAEVAALEVSDRSGAEAARGDVTAAAAALEEAAARAGALSVVTGAAGRLDLPEGEDLEGRFLREGALVGHILPEQPPTIRVALDPRTAPLVRDRLRGAEVRFAHSRETVHRATVLRAVPGGDRRLISPVLTLEGGGPFATTSDGDGAQVTAERLFAVDLGLEASPAQALPYGLRAYVRFDFPPEPILWQAGRSLRHLFLSAFDV